MCLAFLRDQKYVLKKAWAFKVLGLFYIYLMAIVLYTGYKEVSEAMGKDIWRKPKEQEWKVIESVASRYY